MKGSLEEQIAALEAKLGPVLGPHISELARLAARAERVREDSPSDWIPHTRWPCPSRRAACKLARSGAVRDVRRTGEGRGVLWLARRWALDEWVERHTQPATGDKTMTPANDAVEPTVDQVNAELGLEPVPAKSRRKGS